MLEDYPYLMTPDHVAAFTGTTSQEIRKLLGRGEMQGCRIGIRWLVPKLGAAQLPLQGSPQEGRRCK